MLPVVTNVRQLTTEDVAEIWAHIEKQDRDDKYNAFDMICSGNDSQERLIEQDFIIADLVIEEKFYKFIHGFPGDEPCGVLYTVDFDIVAGLHWSMDKGFDALSDWYLQNVNRYDGDEDDFETDIPKSWFAPK